MRRTSLPARIAWRALAALACACGTLLPARAQTLFIDLNNAGTEIAVVRRHPAPGASSAPGGSPAADAQVAPGLYVVPTYRRITPAARAQVMRAAMENERLTTLAQDCAAPEPGRAPRGCDTVWDALRQSEVAREAATGHYGFDDLRAEIEAVLARVPRFDRVVVSGHHEGGFFRGELVTLTRAQWEGLFARIQQQAAAPHTVLLLGCDTAEPEVLRSVFLPRLAHPAQTLVVGAEAPAPTRFEARNLDFLHAALGLEPRIHREPQQLRAFQQQLRGHRWPVALWLGGRYESQDHGEALDMPADGRDVAPLPAAPEPPQS